MEQLPARIWRGTALLGPGQEDAAAARGLRHLAESLTLALFLPASEGADAAADE